MVFTFLSDTFTGTTGTDLTGHAPAPTQFGSVAWDVFTTAPSWVFKAGGGIVAPDAAYYSRIDLAGCPLNNTTRFTFRTGDGTGGLLVYMRWILAGTNTFIEVAFNFATNTVQVRKTIAGTDSGLQSTAFSYSAATNYAAAITLATSGGTTTVSVSIDGTPVGAPVAISDAGVQASGLLAFGSDGGTSANSLSIAGLTVETPAATTATVTGPGSITVGTPSSNYTATLNLPAPDGGLSFAEAASGFSATFSPNPKVIAAGATTGTFVATSSTAGTGTIGGTASGVTVTAASVTSTGGAATSFALTGPASGYANNASAAFTVTPNGVTTGTFTPTPVTGVTFSPTTLAWSGDATARTFTILKTTAATVSVNGTFSNSLTPPSSLSYTFNPQTLAASPSSIPASSTTTVTFTEAGGRWNSTPPTITASGVAGVTVGPVTVADDTHATAPVTTGTATGTITYADTSVAAAPAATQSASPVVLDGAYYSQVSGFTPGLSTVSYRFYDAANSPVGGPVTAGITERAPGTYGALVTIPGNVPGEIRWSSGGGSPVYAGDAYNPPSATAVVSGTVNSNVVSINGVAARMGDGTATAATSTTITIPSAANLAGWKVRVVSAAAGADQVATIASSSTSTGVQTLGSAWATTPTGTIVYELIAPTPADVIAIRGTPAQVGDGTATAATSTTITIPSTSDLTGWTVRVLSATTGADQARVIASSNTGTGVQTLATAWAVTPTGTIAYQLDGPGTLAASQPNYAPAKAGDAMALTSAYDPAKTAAQATALATLSTAVGTPAQSSALATLGAAVGTPAQASALSSLAITVGTPAQASALSSLSTMVGTPAQAGTALSTAVWTNAKAANLDATVSSRSVFAGGSVTSVIGSVGSVTAPVTVGTNSDKAGYTVSTVTDKTGYALTSTYDPAKTAAQASQIPAAFTSATFSSNGVFSPGALAAAPTGSGSGAGATLSQLQGELDARGLTSTTTTRIDAAVSTRATASAVSSLATAVGSPAQSSALSTLATTIGTPTTTSIAADIQTRSTFGGGTVSANVVSINGVAARMGDGTASAVGSGSITIPSTADLKGWGVRILSATTGADQVGVVASSNTGTGVQTLKASWPVTPTGAVAYELVPPSMLSAYGVDNVMVEANYSLKDAHKVSLTADLARCTGNGTGTITVGTLPAPTRNGSGTAIGATMADVTATINGQTAKVGEDRANTTVNLSNT